MMQDNGPPQRKDSATLDSKNNSSLKRKTIRRKRQPQNKKQKTDNVSVYVHAFDNKEALERSKAWDRVKVDKKLNYVPIDNSPNPAAEAALYNECDLSVSCTLHGIFSDALVQIEELLQDSEKAPEFNMALGTSDLIENIDGSEVEMEYPTKKQFKWYHRVPV